MRVVVTGGTGRAGQWVVRTLAEAGHEVVNVDLADRPDLELPGQFCRLDLTDAGKVYDALFQFRPEGICAWPLGAGFAAAFTSPSASRRAQWTSVGSMVRPATRRCGWPSTSRPRRAAVRTRSISRWPLP